MMQPWIFAVGREKTGPLNHRHVTAQVFINAERVKPEMVKMLIANLEITLKAITPEMESPVDNSTGDEQPLQPPLKTDSSLPE